MNMIRNIKNALRQLGALTRKPPASVPAQCNNISALLMHLCDFDQALYSYVIKWLAYPLQHQGARLPKALIVNGPANTGSMLFFDHVVASLYGDDARYVQAHSLPSFHNPWIEGGRFALVNGVPQGAGMAKLKQLITADVVPLTRKGGATMMIPNHLNFVIISTSPDFLPVALEGRRFRVIEAPPAREPVFYNAVVAEIENGGIEAFRHYLQHSVDLGGFAPDSHAPSFASPAPAMGAAQ